MLTKEKNVKKNENNAYPFRKNAFDAFESSAIARSALTSASEKINI